MLSLLPKSGLITLAAGTATCGLLLTGCSTEHSLDHNTLAGKVKTALENKVGQKAKSVQCPDDLKGKVGATTRCTLQAMDGSKIGVTVTVTSAHGSDIKFEAEADQKPMQ